MKANIENYDNQDQETKIRKIDKQELLIERAERNEIVWKVVHTDAGSKNRTDKAKELYVKPDVQMLKEFKSKARELANPKEMRIENVEKAIEKEDNSTLIEFQEHSRENYLSFEDSLCIRKSPTYNT